MKKIINSLFSAMGNKEKGLNNTNTVVNSNTVFTSADLWNIHRNGKVWPQRRFL